MISATPAWGPRLAQITEDIIRRMNVDEPGSESLREFVEALVVGNYASVKLGRTEGRMSRLMAEIPSSAGRERVYRAAAETFADEPHLLAHYGRYLYTEEARFTEARNWLFRALSLAEDDPLILHMIGMSYRRELGEVLTRTQPSTRPASSWELIDSLYSKAAEFFEKTRKKNPNDHFGHASQIECLIQLVKDRFRYHIGTPPHVAMANDAVIRQYLDEAEHLIRSSEQFVPGNSWIAKLRGEVKALTGNRDQAIRIFKDLLKLEDLPDAARVRRHLARALYDRGTSKPEPQLADIRAASAELDRAIKDEPGDSQNFELWFDCARLDPALNKLLITERLENYLVEFPQLGEELIPSFYLASLYLVRALEERNPEALDRYSSNQAKAKRLAQDLSYRSYIREWLGPEYTLRPGRLITYDKELSRFDVSGLPRISGNIREIRSTTEGYISVPPWNLEIFFSPSRRDHRFYQADVGKPVTFVVAFTWEKPIAYDPRLAA